MEKEYYRDAFEFAMKELKEEYKSNNNEDDFNLWFNMTFVKDTIDSITVSVPSAFMQKMMTSKGYFAIVEKKLQHT